MRCVSVALWVFLVHCYTVVDLRPPLPGSPLHPLAVPGPDGVEAVLSRQGLSGRHLETVRGLTGLYDRYCVRNPAFSFSWERFVDALREVPDLPACYGIYFDLFGTELPEARILLPVAEPP